MKRRDFVQKAGILGVGLAVNKFSFAAENQNNFPTVRVPSSKRHFTSRSVEDAIKTFSSKVKDRELAWLFGNCYPNTLDTTVYYSEKKGKPFTYVITGDIDAMWLRDSSAQVYPYLEFVRRDAPLKKLIAGVINKQTEFILKDPYANAFYNDPDKKGEWFSDFTDMQPGVHERKWEIDSLCYPIRLAHGYWKETGDTAPFDTKWEEAIKATLKTFKEQQRKDGNGPYKFQRRTQNPTDSLPMHGYGNPVNPVGLIVSAFRPSDDASIFSFLVPSNFFAVTSLRQAAEMMSAIRKNTKLAGELLALAEEVEKALKEYAVFNHPKYGKIYAFEVDGFHSYNLMDDANVPSLLAMPYLKGVQRTDPVYVNTRKFIWSKDNPHFYKGTTAEGIGGPHIGKDMIWPMSIIMKALTSNDDKEIKWCIDTLKKTHGNTGFMHESFHKDDPKNFTRSWFAWTNTLFGELLWNTLKHKPHLLS
ncbi:glycoside hydrolase family 125 protein [Haoranjiania flava]|uniref:Glycoside hydrolase family 125 protein n=1 Tax=Haoranjiania flava TaxID=1856322 RepID=A0AAE3IME9_9BACT|nr:glycoside hydrolase family 125 protein [Haoranjiania flava]MCU7694279.1 glycoside hydrolase family 125 protein [Haoranjiania flava]